MSDYVKRVRAKVGRDFLLMPAVGALIRDAEGRIERHFVILCFAARWRSGEPVLNEELDEARWLDPAALSNLRTTEGLAEIVAAAVACLARQP